MDANELRSAAERIIETQEAADKFIAGLGLPIAQPAREPVDVERLAEVAYLEDLKQRGIGNYPLAWKALDDYARKHWIAVVQAVLARTGAEWRPIADAPKDGTHILLFRQQIQEGSWHEADPNSWHQTAYWGGPGWSYPEWDEPTHWMPLPPPPARKETADE